MVFKSAYCASFIICDVNCFFCELSDNSNVIRCPTVRRYGICIKFSILRLVFAEIYVCAVYNLIFCQKMSICREVSKCICLALILCKVVPCYGSILIRSQWLIANGHVTVLIKKENFSPVVSLIQPRYCPSSV